ncbi:MAG: VTT domain-containing protein [Promethearchaeota archaeon]
MSVPKLLTIIFIGLYVAVTIYLLLFFLVPSFQEAIIESRNSFTSITEGPNYYWALLIVFIVCFLGSASIAFPVPFPFILFSFSNTVYLKYLNKGMDIVTVLEYAPFWVEILGFAIVGGLGCALGEVTGYIVGYSAKKVTEETHSDILNNIDGFGKVVLEHKNRIPFYVFFFALTPLPDDILFLPLGMMKYPFWKCIIPGWLGKNFTTLFYCIWPILVALGFMVGGLDSDAYSSIITEAVMLLVTITVMFFIMGYNWNEYLEKRKTKKDLKA